MSFVSSSNIIFNQLFRGNKKLEGRLSDKNKSKKKARVMYKDLDPKRHGHE